MKPAAFDYFRPGTVDEATELLDRFGDDARVIAGGQSLVPSMNLRMATPAALVDIGGIGELVGWTKERDRIRIGAGTTQAALMRDRALATELPLLASALPHVGHVQTRSRGTIGGSLAHADPSAEIGLVAAALDAEFVLRSSRGERRLGASEFQLGALTTAIEPEELLVEVVVPAAAAGARLAFRELARRHGDFAIVAVAAQVSGSELVVAIGGLEEVPRRCDIAAGVLADAALSCAAIDQAIAAELRETEPLADLHAGADYRLELAAVLMNECLEEILA